jgi:hypothetical protein
VIVFSVTYVQNKIFLDNLRHMNMHVACD